MSPLASSMGIQVLPPVGEQRLLVAALRIFRQKRARTALILHLSRLTAGPRSYHYRIGQTLLEEAALRHEGEVFTRADGDLVLVCPANGGLAAAGLAQLLSEMFSSSGVKDLVSVIELDQGSEALLAYARTRINPPARTVAGPEIAAAATERVNATEALISGLKADEFLHRQFAILIAPREEPRGFRPLFQEITFSLAALAARSTSFGQVTSDPFLLRHVAAGLDLVMLERNGEAICTSAVRARPAGLHLNLTLATLRSAAFSRFVQALRQREVALGIEVALIEACNDPIGFARARDLLHREGVGLALDGVSPASLVLSDPAGLAPDLLKLDWDPRLALASRGDGDALEETFARLGPDRILLQRADSEAAILWGRQRGLRRFQGRHVDAMLGLARFAACPQAQRCALGVCVTMGRATTAARRPECRNPALLDSAVPPTEPAG